MALPRKQLSLERGEQQVPGRGHGEGEPEPGQREVSGTAVAALQEGEEDRRREDHRGLLGESRDSQTQPRRHVVAEIPPGRQGEEHRTEQPGDGDAVEEHLTRLEDRQR